MDAPVRRIAGALRAGEITASALLEACLDRIARLNPVVNAIVYLDLAGAAAAATASDARLREGRPLGPLDGIPVVVKDNLLMRDCPAVWGSALFDGYVPRHDELPVAKLRATGVVLLGKANVPELAMRGYTGNTVYGVTRNPWDAARTPGGSSGGAVAAVAAGMAPLALATDGGGSIRRPCSYTNLAGLKPSAGRIRRSEGFPRLMFDYEVAGPIGRYVDDIRLMFESLAAPAPRQEGPRRILYVERLGEAPVDPEILRLCRSAARDLEQLGYDVTEGTLPFDIAALDGIGRTLTAAGLAHLAQQHQNFFDVASTDFAELAEAGLRLPPAEIAGAVDRLLEFRSLAGEAFDSIGWIMTPAAAAQPWPAGQEFPPEIAGQPVGPRGHAVFTGWVNACGHPAVAIPAGFDSTGVPAGFQIAGQLGSDEALLDIAAEFECTHPWSQTMPEMVTAI